MGANRAAAPGVRGVRVPARGLCAPDPPGAWARRPSLGSAPGALSPPGFWVERTAVHEAAQQGEALRLQQLIEGGACVNQVTVDSITPLHAASLQGQAQCVRLLLAAGAQVSRVPAPRGVGGTPRGTAGCQRGRGRPEGPGRGRKRRDWEPSAR